MRVIGLGDWGVRAVEFFASRGVPAHAVETDGGLVTGDLARILTESEDELLVVVGHAGSRAGALMGAVLELASEVASDVGRLAIARLPGVQSAPDDRARGLIALNTLLEAPEASIFLVQPTRGLGISAELEANEVMERVVRLLELPRHGAVTPLSPAALAAHLATPGFVGWREIELSLEMCSQDAPGWMESLPGRGAAWQPQGFAWSDAQSVLPIARLPQQWINEGGREQFDRFVQEAWGEAAPCAIARSLQVGDPPMGMILSTGLSYPEGLLELRDSVQEDRERLAEKRRAAATPIPLGDDFMSPPIAQRSKAPRTTPRASILSNETRVDRRESIQESEPAASAPTRQAGAEPTHLEEQVHDPETARPSGDRAADRPRHEGPRAGVAALSHESMPDRLDLEPVEEEHGFAETRTVVVTAAEIDADEVVASEIAPVEEDAAVVPTAELKTEEMEEEPGIDEAPRIDGAPRVSPYEAALSLAWRVLNTDDLETEVDLGEIRYALYDLLEVMREDPGSILREVFRRTEKDYFERHHVNVAVLSILTAEQLGATLSDIIDLATAAILHDIGMSDSREAWDADVRLAPKVFDTTIRQHPERGNELLKQIPGMTPDVARIVREEHERLDGTGYPEGLSGDAIDPGARIVAVADTLEALTHARPYRERLTLGEALSRLQILGQYTLDMAVVQTLTDALTEYMPSLDTGSDEA
ncbi:MAG: HD domain-containing phosphohydrolase [Gemmatimonadota bacterium]